MAEAQLVLEYLKVILAAPPVSGAVALVFIWVLKDEVRGLVRRIAKIKVGGSEVSTSQIDRSAEALQSPASPALVASSEPAPVLPEGVDQDSGRRLLEMIHSERTRAVLWEYRFLNLFLVHHTQQALDWLVSLPERPSLAFADARMQGLISSAKERVAVLVALESHALVRVVDGLIEVTPKGREYVQWRGPLPPLPASTAAR
jgi:hypothetical protein